jgi:hypothetical protein
LIAGAGKDILRSFIKAAAHPLNATVSLSMKIHTAESGSFACTMDCGCRGVSANFFQKKLGLAEARFALRAEMAT